MSGRRQERSSTRPHGSRRGTRRTRGQKVSHSISNVLILERRVLIGVTLFTLLGSVFWIVAISTDYWYTVTVPSSDGLYVQSSHSFLIRNDVGLWRMCTTQRAILNNATNETGDAVTNCRNFNMFPSRVEVEKKQDELDYTSLDYTRTETAFAIIAMILMIMGHGFSCYTFMEHRYMFKRLAGGVHFLTAATTVVVVEVLNNSAKHAASHFRARHPEGSSWHYGFSFVLAWISFVTFLVAGIAFIACSRKRKGMNLPNELYPSADEPNILGRA